MEEKLGERREELGVRSGRSGRGGHFPGFLFRLAHLFWPPLAPALPRLFVEFCLWQNSLKTCGGPAARSKSSATPRLPHEVWSFGVTTLSPRTNCIAPAPKLLKDLRRACGPEQVFRYPPKESEEKKNYD